MFTSTDTLAPGERIFESVREIDPAKCVAVVARHPITELPDHAQPKDNFRSRTGAPPNTQPNSAMDETESSELWAEAFPSGGGGGMSANSQLDPCSQQFG